MRRLTVVTFAVAALALSGCGGDDDAPAVPARVTNEVALKLIRSCDASRFLTAHSGEVRLTLEDGETTSVLDPDTDALREAAVNANLEGCDIAVGME
jgi:hypothetical protein